MVNLLIVDINERTREYMYRAMEELRADYVCSILACSEDMERFRVFGDCYYEGNIVRGKYADAELDCEHCRPLEDDVFSFMSPYFLEIMNQQRRYEQHSLFPIDNTWENHYEIYMKNLYFFYNLLISKQITHVFFRIMPHQGFDAIIYHLTQLLNIPVIMSLPSLIPKRDYALVDYTKADEAVRREYRRLLELYKEVPTEEIELEGDTKEQFERWASLDPVQMKPFFMYGNKMKKTFHARYGVTNIINAWRGILGQEYEVYGWGLRFIGAAVKKTPKLIQQIPDTYRRWTSAKSAWKSTKELTAFYESVATVPQNDAKYIYFALHYQPEATSNPMGRGAYCDQRIPLQILSRSVPDNVYIYVKAHPDQLAFFCSISYYKDILRMPHVRLMKMECSTYDLMRNAVAVASLTGTACWESQFFGIPAILFGYSVKNSSPLAYPVRTVEECKRALRDIFDHKKKVTLKELKLYTKAAHNLSYSIEDRNKVFPQLIKQLIGQE